MKGITVVTASPRSVSRERERLVFPRHYVAAYRGTDLVLIRKFDHVQIECESVKGRDPNHMLQRLVTQGNGKGM
jgi:hypothetical protein